MKKITAGLFISLDGVVEAPARLQEIARGFWFVVVGVAVGLALGILVSLVSDVPFAPEAGLLVGALVGWFAATARNS